MIRFLIPLALLASPAVAQDSIATRLDKVVAETTLLDNAAGRALYACERDQRDKCIAEVRATRNAAARAEYAAKKARELVTPAPTPASALSGTLSEGDSNSVFWSGNHTGIYAAQHPGEPFYGRAVGGSTLADLEKRFAADAALRPARVTVMVGTNYMAPTFLADLAAYAARWQATGAKVYLATLLPKCDAAFNAARAVANAGIRKIKVTGIIDFAADPVIGPDAAGCDKALYHDGVHLTEAGQKRAALVYGAKLDGKPAPGAPHDHVPPPAADILAPAPDLDFGFGLDKGTVPSWNTGIIPGPYEPDAGAFRFICAGDGPLSYDDPVVYPGQPGAAHLHDVFGNLAFDAFTTRETLAANAATNCNVTPFSHNRSSYWMPALIHDSGQVIRPDITLVYYKRKRSSSPACTPGNRAFVGICSPLPNGIRFVFGWDMKQPTVQPPPGSAQWACTGVPGHFPDLAAVFAAGCEAGDTLIAMTLAPNCWDGKRLDSADHRAHVAYVTYADGSGIGRCPATHPFLIPQEEAKSQFTVTADMVNRIRLSSDAMNPGGKPGASLHGDYWEAWSAVGKAAWTEHCIEKGLNCSGGDLGNGRQLIGAGMPAYGWTNPNPRQASPTR